MSAAVPSQEILRAVRSFAVDLCDVVANRTMLVPPVSDSWADLGYRLNMVESNRSLDRLLCDPLYGPNRLSWMFNTYTEYLDPPGGANAVLLGAAVLCDVALIGPLCARVVPNHPHPSQEVTIGLIRTLAENVISVAAMSWSAGLLATTGALWGAKDETERIRFLLDPDHPIGQSLTSIIPNMPPINRVQQANEPPWLGVVAVAVDNALGDTSGHAESEVVHSAREQIWDILAAIEGAA